MTVEIVAMNWRDYGTPEYNRLIRYVGGDRSQFPLP